MIDEDLDAALDRMALKEHTSKAALIRRFVENKFSPEYIITIGTHMTKKGLSFEYEGAQIDMTMVIWDIIGQDGFESLHEAYFRGAHGGLVVTDRTRIASLFAAEDWAKRFRNVAGQVPLVFIANKADLPSPAVKMEHLGEVAARFGSPTQLTSALTGDGVEKAFRTLGESMARQTK